MDSGGLGQLPQCFLNLNWENSVDPSGQFGSASFADPGEGFRFGNHGRGLQSVGKGISPQPSQHVGGPMSSLSKIDLAWAPSSGHLTPAHLDQFPAVPSSADRAARFIGINGGNFPWLASQVELPGKEKPLMVASSQSLMTTGLKIGHLGSNMQIPVLDELKMEMSNSELGKAGEEISATMSPSGEASNGMKRKVHLKRKEKDVTDPSKVAEEDGNAKRQRYMENCNATGNNNSAKPKLEEKDGTNTIGEQKQGKDCNVKPSEPPKDYVHVRARRGQATDSHSLAERVRREKISQRMKLLQDLVPGCGKVIGKAVMLDEIINYVQSLQHQVEFLSMKLATVNPRLDFSNLMNLLPKEMFQTCGAVPNSIYQFETGITSTYSNHVQPRNPFNCITISEMNPHYYMNMLDPTFHHNLSEFGNASSQSGVFWEDDLQSVVQMSMGYSQDFQSSSENFNGTSPTAQ